MGLNFAQLCPGTQRASQGYSMIPLGMLYKKPDTSSYQRNQCYFYLIQHYIMVPNIFDLRALNYNRWVFPKYGFSGFNCIIMHCVLQIIMKQYLIDNRELDRNSRVYLKRTLTYQGHCVGGLGYHVRHQQRENSLREQYSDTWNKQTQTSHGLTAWAWHPNAKFLTNILRFTMIICSLSYAYCLLLYPFSFLIHFHFLSIILCTQYVYTYILIIIKSVNYMVIMGVYPKRFKVIIGNSTSLRGSKYHEHNNMKQCTV